MAQQVLFYDSFTGPAGTHILDHAPEIGSWIAGPVYSLLGLDGGGRLDGEMPDIGGDSSSFVDTANVSVSAPTMLEFAVSAYGSGFTLLGDIDGNWATSVSEVYGDFNFSHNGVDQSVSLSATSPRKVAIRISATDAKLLVDESVVATITSASDMSSVAHAALSVDLPTHYVGLKLDYAVILADPDGTWTPPPDPVIALEAIASAPSPLSTAAALADVPIICSIAGVALASYGDIAAASVVMPHGVSPIEYGQVLAAYDVTVGVAQIEPSTRSGTPLAWHVDTQDIATTHSAYGAFTTCYGTLVAGYPQLVDVSGMSATDYGVPSAAAVVHPETALTTMAGQPSAAAVAFVAGVRGTQYGTPTNVVAHIVSGVCRTKYGRPRVAFPDAHMVYGLNNGRRAGVPRAVELV